MSRFPVVFLAYPRTFDNAVYRFLTHHHAPLDKPSRGRHRRYVITDLAMALCPDSPRELILAVRSALYDELADFALRTNGCWSATGKAIPRALAAITPDLARRFETAFTALFATLNVTPVQTLVDDLLQPLGGRLREGYRQSAPPTWTDEPPDLT